MLSDKPNTNQSKVFSSEEQKTFIRQSVWNNIEKQVSKKQSVKLVWHYATAACVATLLTSVVLMYSGTINTGKVEWITYTNQSSVSKKLWLPDSSCIWVPHNSTVEWRTDYNLVERKVRLASGECFFEVRKQHGRPFTVITDNIQTRVLGTSFLVRKDDLSNITVAVLTGKVSISRNDSIMRLLLPGDQLTVNEFNGQHAYTSVQTGDILLWKQGKRVLREQTIASIAAYFSSYYQTRIELAPSIKENKDKYTVIFFASSPIETVMEMLKTVAPHIIFEKRNASGWEWKIDSR